jgi:predicted tellurium resistance membrane protein TerC
MADLLSLHNLFDLGVLIFLQAVLGFDNLLYISLESKKVEASKQSMVRKWGIGLAIGLRLVLLVVLLQLFGLFQTPFFEIRWTGVLEGGFTVESAIVLVGGGFIVWTAFKEISHMLSIDQLGGGGGGERRSAAVAIAWIVVMNLVFSFDSILSAIAITRVVPVLAIAIVTSGVLMMVLADRVAGFLQRNRMYEVLGLFILLIVGVMLLGEGGHQAHLSFFGHPVEPMAKSTFYFSIFVLVVVDVAQGRYQKKLAATRRAGQTA